MREEKKSTAGRLSGAESSRDDALEHRIIQYFRNMERLIDFIGRHPEFEKMALNGFAMINAIQKDSRSQKE